MLRYLAHPIFPRLCYQAPNPESNLNARQVSVHSQPKEDYTCVLLMALWKEPSIFHVDMFSRR